MCRSRAVGARGHAEGVGDVLAVGPRLHEPGAARTTAPPWGGRTTGHGRAPSSVRAAPTTPARARPPPRQHPGRVERPSPAQVLLHGIAARGEGGFGFRNEGERGR